MAKVGEPGNLVPEIFWAGIRKNRDFFSQHIDISVLTWEILFQGFEKSKLAKNISVFRIRDMLCNLLIVKIFWAVVPNQWYDYKIKF